jgi:diguanylate cyclase (GGDEF)-like protein
MTESDAAEAPDVPPEVAAQLARALDRSPSTFAVLVGPDLKTRWLSRSAVWLSGVDPDSRKGRGSLERVHPDDIPRILHAYEQLYEANEAEPGVAIVEPLRYRVGSAEGGWVTRESLVVNMLNDPAVNGLLLIVRPVEGALDGVGYVVDLLVAEAPLPEVLAACATLVPSYLGAAVVVGQVDGCAVVGVPAGSPVEQLGADERWWRPTLEDGESRTPLEFDGFPDDLVAQARAADFRSAWVFPVTEASTGEVTGCVAVWVRIDVKPNLATDQGLLQTQRLASLVIGEQRRHHALRLQAVTDPLTGVANRSALRRRLDAAAGEVTVAFLDVDDFKAVNDTFGHDAGDRVLQEVARRISVAIREDDLVVRLGGDEFAVVFADGTPADAIDDLVTRLTAAINTDIELGPTAVVSPRASIGVATGPPTEVIHQADNALYATKRARGA